MNRKTFLQDETGITSVEYVVLLVLLAMACMSSWRAFGSRVRQQAVSSTMRMEVLADSIPR